MARKKRAVRPVGMTLPDMLFSQGFGTRFDCRALVLSGKVSLSGEVFCDPEALLDPEGLVFECLGRSWPVREHALIALHKPAGYECSVKPSANPSVMTLLPGPLRRRGVQPVGRLDADTTGLLLLTDDGALTHRLIHPKNHVEKCYVATLRHPANLSFCRKLIEGVVLDDDPRSVRACSARLLDPVTLELVLDQGKYHQVKRMVAAASNRVEALHRTRVGHFELPAALAPGAWMWIGQGDVL